ncbi:hypothetical protein HDV00_006615 [Rhizophlyctis rosea]|nr:hypothetical protein HDV00_006615 [Rhizophlyctis rosea]
MNGPYRPSRYFTDSSLQRHTIYQPQTIPSGASFPILVWGEGACAADGTAVQNFLHNIASYGFVIIANGSPGGSGTTAASWLTDSLNWVSQKAGSSGYQHYDTSRIAAAGWSCGGLEAYEMRSDSRVKAIGIFNSGQYDQSGTNNVMPGVKVPIFYFLGGSSDIAYNNGERDYRYVNSGLPKWKGNLPVGHGATYQDTNGGKFGTAAANWLMYVLKGDSTAASWFTGSGARNDGWSTESANLNLIPVGSTTTTTRTTTTTTTTTTTRTTTTTTTTQSANPSVCTYSVTPEASTVWVTPTVTVTADQTGSPQTTTTTTTTQSTGSCAARFAQCGGQGFTGPTCCQSGSTCKASNQWYSQCL